MKKIQQEFEVRGNETKSLVVSLDYVNPQRMSNLVVLCDGKNVGFFADAAGAKDGVGIDVPDLGKVDIRINASAFSKPKIFVTVNGHVLRATKAKKQTDAKTLTQREKWEKSLQSGVGVLFFISAVSGIGGIFAILFNVEFLLEMGMGGYTICGGLIYLGLGYAARDISWGGLGALVVAYLLYVADTYLVVTANGGSMVFIRVVFMVVLMQAIYASWRLVNAPPEEFENPFVKVA